MPPGCDAWPTEPAVAAAVRKTARRRQIFVFRDAGEFFVLETFEMRRRRGGWRFYHFVTVRKRLMVFRWMEWDVLGFWREFWPYVDELPIAIPQEGGERRGPWTVYRLRTRGTLLEIWVHDDLLGALMANELFGGGLNIIEPGVRG